MRIKIEQNTNNKYLDIYGINYRDKTLITRYFGKNFNKTFFTTNNMHSKFLFIRYYTIPKTFALELYYLFLGLYKITKSDRYKSAAENIYNLSWVGKINKNKIEIDKKVRDKLKDIIDAELYNYQIEFIDIFMAVRKTGFLRGLYLAYKQGLGKTLIGIALTEILNKDQTVIVVPNTLKMVWYNEFIKFDKRYKDDIKRVEEEIYVHGKTPIGDKIEHRIVIVNYESFVKIKDKLPNNNKFLIVDESHSLKDIKSQRTQHIINFVFKHNIEDIVLSSGTPLKGMSIELLPPLIILDKYIGGDKESLTIYKKLLNGIKNRNMLSILNKRFDLISVKKTKLDVEGELQLPPKHHLDLMIKFNNYDKYRVEVVRRDMNEYIKKYIESEKDKLKSYQDEVDNIIKKTKNKSKYLSDKYDTYMKIIRSIRKDPMYKMTETEQKLYSKYNSLLLNKMDKKYKKRYKEIVGKANNIFRSAVGKALGKVYMPRLKEGAVDMVKNIKRQLKKVLEKSATKKVVVFTSYPEAVEEFVNRYDEQYGVVSITSNDSFQDRSEKIRKYIESDKIFLIGTFPLMSTGLTITESDSIIFINEPWRWVDKEQAEDRIHRKGQVNECYIYTCRLDAKEKTIFDRVNDIVGTSKDIFDTIMSKEVNISKRSGYTSYYMTAKYNFENFIQPLIKNNLLGGNNMKLTEQDILKEMELEYSLIEYCVEGDELEFIKKFDELVEATDYLMDKGLDISDVLVEASIENVKEGSLKRLIGKGKDAKLTIKDARRIGRKIANMKNKARRKHYIRKMYALGTFFAGKGKGESTLDKLRKAMVSAYKKALKKK